MASIVIAIVFDSCMRCMGCIQIAPTDIDHFRSILSPSQVLTQPDAISSYNRDWMKKFEGETKLVLLPKSTEQLSAILRHCHARSLAVVPQGGNTGLVGGSVPVFDEIVISLKLMNQITAFDEYSGIVTSVQ